jgi:hypothetical protein
MKPTSKSMRASLEAVLALPLLFLGLAGHASTVLGQTMGTFTATGDMTTARYWHTATLLTDGRVLIAGGVGRNPLPGPLASAELYDPSTGTFTPTGSMITARAGHSAFLLLDGRVLIAGGRWAAGPASAELYDPSTGTFTATGHMTPNGTSTLLNNGKVLFAGATATLYDPATGTFTATGAYAANGAGFGVDLAIMLANGTVLVASCDSQTELYHPDTGTFSITGPLPAWRCSPSATLLLDGKVLIAGGDNDMDYIPIAEVYDPSTGIFTATGKMTSGREHHTATLLPDATVLIAGGSLIGGTALGSAELYDPVTGTFAAAGYMTFSRYSHTATLLRDGTVLIAGGFTDDFDTRPVPPGATPWAEIYKPPSLRAAPLLFSVSGDGRGQGAILHTGTPQLASPSNPAVVGEALEVYCTGLIDGSVNPSASSHRRPDGRGSVLWQRSRIRRPGSSECPGAERRCARTCRPRALDVPWPAEQ